MKPPSQTISETALERTAQADRLQGPPSSKTKAAQWH